MMRHLQPVFDFLLYANFWVAGAALAMAAQTQLLLSGRILATPLLGFVFWGALSLYGVHRLVGLKRLGEDLPPGRYQRIARLKGALQLIVPVAAVLTGFCFYQLQPSVKLAALGPALLALGYVLPLWRGRRLRDLPYLKIFLVVVAWSWVIVGLPGIELGLGKSIPMWIMALERGLFLFALALVFDLRDMEADRQDGVETLAARLGLRRSKALAWSCLLAMLALVGLNHHIDVYSTAHFAALAFSALATGSLIAAAGAEKTDYFYSGALDGMMILQFLLLWLLPFLAR